MGRGRHSPWPRRSAALLGHANRWAIFRLEDNHGEVVKTSKSQSDKYVGGKRQERDKVELEVQHV